MNATLKTPTDPQARFTELLARERRGRNSLTLQITLVAFGVLVSLWATGMFDVERLSEGLPAIGVVGSEMNPESPSSPNL